MPLTSDFVSIVRLPTRIPAKGPQAVAIVHLFRNGDSPMTQTLVRQEQFSPVKFLGSNLVQMGHHFPNDVGCDSSDWVN
jgi:hypothetical protein